MNSVVDIYNKALEFKKKYPKTIAWRLKSHAKVVHKFLNPGEEVQYVFVSQKNYQWYNIMSTYMVVLTNKRILLAQKRLLFGYWYLAITPDMFNDLTVKSGIIWGKVNLDTIKEIVVLSNIDKRALPEIETAITEYMMEKKQQMIKIEKNQVNI